MRCRRSIFVHNLGRFVSAVFLDPGAVIVCAVVSCRIGDTTAGLESQRGTAEPCATMTLQPRHGRLCGFPREYASAAHFAAEHFIARGHVEGAEAGSGKHGI